MFPPFRAFILVALPGALQSVFAALGDFYTWKLAMDIYGRESNAPWAAVSLVSRARECPPELTFPALDDGAQPLAVVLLHQDLLQRPGDDPDHRRSGLLAMGTAC